MSTNYSPTIVTDGAVFVGDARTSSTATAGSRLYDQAGVDSANVKLLIHGNEGSGQSFTDSSLSNHAITAVGNITHSTTKSKFSGGSIYYDDSGDYLSIPASTDWVFSGDFTIDFWCYIDSTQSSNYSHFFTLTSQSVMSFKYQLSGNLLYLYTGGTDITCTIDLENAWHHVALVRSGTGSNNLQIFVDGISQVSASKNDTWGNSTGTAYIGWGWGTEWFKGYMDEVRVTQGTALWTQNFTPPAKRDTLSISDGMMYNGTCIDLDGTDDYIDLGSIAFGTKDISVAVWFTLTEFDDDYANVFCNRTSSAGNVGFSIRQRTAADTIELQFDWGAGSNAVETGTISEGVWHHIVATIDRSGYLRGYLNGVEFGTPLDISSYSATSITSDESAKIGIDAFGNYWNGKVGDLKIYENTVLSASQVTELYNDSKVIIPSNVSQTNLMGWWPLAEGAGTLCYDGSGNGQTGTITNGEDDEWLTGQTGCPQLVEGYNRKLLFSGDDYVDCGNNSSLNFTTSNFSISCWVYIHDLTDVGYIVRRGGWGSNGWYTYLDTSGRLQIYTNDSGQGDPHTQTMSNSSVITANTWHHIVWVRNGATGVIYVDGTDETASGDSMIDPATSTNTCYIGSATNYISGIVDEVIVYDTVVTSSQAAALHATDANGGPLPPDPMSGASSLPSTSNVVSYWRNEGSGTWTDRGNNSNDGTPAGTPTTLLFKQGINGSASTSTGRDNQGFPLKYKDVGAVGFNDTDGYIDAGTGFNHTGALTCEVWASMHTGSGVIFSQWVQAGNKRKWFIGMNTTNVLFYIDSAGSGTFTNVDGGAFSTDGKFHSYAFVYIPSVSLTAYIDGVVVGTDTSSVASSIYSSTDVNIYLGRSGVGEYWDGQIANARIYTRALSYAEIQQNYKAQRSRFT